MRQWVASVSLHDSCCILKDKSNSSSMSIQFRVFPAVNFRHIRSLRDRLNRSAIADLCYFIYFFVLFILSLVQKMQIKHKYSNVEKQNENEKEKLRKQI